MHASGGPPASNVHQLWLLLNPVVKQLTGSDLDSDEKVMYLVWSKFGLFDQNQPNFEMFAWFE